MGDRATVRPIGNPMENILAQEAKITANNTKNSVDVFILFAKAFSSVHLWAVMLVISAIYTELFTLKILLQFLKSQAKSVHGPLK